jgi:sugar (pentulose or hexulose) kinase
VEEYMLGVDIGTQGSKGVLADAAGSVVASHFVEHGVIHSRPGWAEHDPETEWWGDFIAITRAIFERARVDASAIAAVCVSGLIPDVAPTDAEGRPVANAILYSDNRAVAEIAEINRRLGLSLTSEEMFPKIVWLFRHAPEVAARTRMVFNAHSYIVYKLTGAYTIDYLTACLFGAVYASRRARWREDVCADFDVPCGILPELRAPADVVGRVHSAAARATGLAEGTPVLAGSGDVYFSLLSAGVTEPGEMMIYYGTAGLGTLLHRDLETLARQPYDVDDAFPFAYPAYFLTSGEAVNWFRDEFAQAETQAARATSTNSLALLDAAAEKVPPGCDGLILLNYLLGQRSPEFDPAARGVLFGLTMSHTRAHVYRAILESYGYGIRHGLEVERDRPEISRVVATGGGARSPLWRQIVSDIVGIAQEYVARADAPLGDAFLAGYAIGLIDDFTKMKREWIQVTATTLPDSAHERIYARYYPIYRSLHEWVKAPFNALACAQNE